MKDLQPYKNKLMELTYEEKVQMSEWLHTEIEFELGEAVKEKAKNMGNKLNSFLEKAADKTKSAGSSLMDKFKSATSAEQQPKK